MIKGVLVMEAIPVAQLKAGFSAILSKIEQTGEGVVVEYGRLHKKVAVLFVLVSI